MTLKGAFVLDPSLPLWQWHDGRQCNVIVIDALVDEMYTISQFSCATRSSAFSSSTSCQRGSAIGHAKC